jgi:3-deoxy-manno-octulosonate cytidylyltransferase (CMP-KDO synthetase)
MSKKSNYLVVIPARYKSKRLPGKPLMDICGKPMIVRTFNQCRKVFPSSKIIVATDDKRIKNVCEENDIRVIMTSKFCLTGTDRMAEVAKKIKVNFYLNVQGDEPLCSTTYLKKLFYASKKKTK